MTRLTKNLPLALVGQLPTVAVLAALAAIALWGGYCDWNLKRMCLIPATPEKDRKAESPGLGPVELDSDQAADKAGLETEPAKSRTVNQQVTANAMLAFDQNRYAQLSTKVSATAWQVRRKAGDRVKKGEVLALLMAPDAGSARANFLTALAQHDMKRITLQRYLASSDTLPERQLREARMALREARLNLLTAQQTLANLGLFVRLEDMEPLGDDQAALRLRLLGLPPDLAASKDSADLPSNLLPIVSPFDGLVIRRDLVVGEHVGPGTQAGVSIPQFVVADNSRMWVQLDVRQEDVARVALGQEVTFTSDSTGQSATGKLTYISPEVDPKTRTVRARAVVPNEDGSLRPATFGTATILISSREALTVPESAVQYDGKTNLLFVRADEKTFEPRLVLPGSKVGGHVELFDSTALVPAQVAGLLAGPADPLHAVLGLHFTAPLLVTPRPGDLIVTTGSHVLRSELLRSRIGGEE